MMLIVYLYCIDLMAQGSLQLHHYKRSLYEIDGNILASTYMPNNEDFLCFNVLNCTKLR